MRSRVEIVARKSDHICVVRDVPDMRGSWFQRQQQSLQSNYSAGGQHSASGSFDQLSVTVAAPTQSSQQLAIAAPPATQTGPTSQPTASGKPSFAALFAKHPAIKEEPTTPGGTLAAETPPPGSKRPPFRLQSGATSPAPSSEQIGQIISLLNDLKMELRQDIGQLTKRVDSMDASIGRVTQTVSKLDRLCAGSQETSDSKSSRPRPSLSLAEQRGKTVAASSAPAPETAQAKLQRLDPVATGATEPASSRAHSRERSKSPHKHHHHHHHHHRKAEHSSPAATPTVSQTDLQQLGAKASSSATSQETGASVELALSAKRRTLDRASLGQGEDRASLQEASKTQPALISSEQSDDDQDATSKL